MTVRRYLCSLLVVVFAGVLSACGSSSGSDADAGSDDASTTTATAAPSKEGEPISEPVCDFVGISPDDASGILRTNVTAASSVGKNDPDGGSCRFVPPTGDDDAVSIAVFPDTEEHFESYIREYTAEIGPSGRPLWTAPVDLPGVGDVAYSFKSPDGGYDNVWVLANGYRVLVSNRNTADVPLAAEAVQSLAEEAVSNL
jgi:hypothetical protein